MSAHAFDTLQAAEMLTRAGIEDGHARAIVATVRDAVTESSATKADITGLEGEMASFKTVMKADLATVQVRIEARIESTANRPLVGGIAIAGVAVAVLKLF